MDINVLSESIKDALATDTSISTWSQAVYGRAHKLYVNADVRDLPAEDDCPYIAFYPSRKKAGHAVIYKEHGFIITSCIYDDASRINPEGNIIEYLGVSRLEDFRKLVENALAAMDIGNALLNTVDIEYETIEFFPFMLVVMDIGIGGVHIAIGENPME